MKSKCQKHKNFNNKFHVGLKIVVEGGIDGDENDADVSEIKIKHRGTYVEEAANTTVVLFSNCQCIRLSLFL